MIEVNPSATLAEEMKGLAKQALSFEPGTRFAYSLCHDVLGRIIEVVSGMTLGEYLKEYIFRPLGMNDTGFFIEDALPNLTEQYAADGAPREIRVIEPMNPYQLTPCYESGGAGSYVLIDVENQIGIFYAQQICGKAMGVEIHSRIRNLVYEALDK